MDSSLKQYDDLEDWLAVPWRALELKEASADVCHEFRQLLPGMPKGVDLWFNPEESSLFLKFDKQASHIDRSTWLKTARDHIDEVAWSVGGDDPDLSNWVKIAHSPLIREISHTLNLTPGKMFGVVPNAPSPLASMLTGGLLGGGLGYGIGALGEYFYPDSWRRGRLRKTLAALGALAGSSPGMAWGYSNWRNGKGLLDRWPNTPENYFKTPGTPQPPLPVIPAPKFQETPSIVDSWLSGETPLSSERKKDASVFYKQGDDDLLSGAGGDESRPVDVDAFNRVIWGDPRVANRLETATQAAASSLVSTAANLGNSGTPNLVWPTQIGALAAGMGSGYLSGALVGKVLGALTGLPDSAQERLKTTGMWAGVVSNVVPMAFGGR